MTIYRKPHNSSKRVLAYKMEHPNYTTSRLAKALKLRYHHVYNTLYTYKALGGEGTLGHVKELIEGYVPKPNSRLAFDIEKNKEEASKPTKGQEILRGVIAGGLSDAVLRSEKASLHSKIDELEALVKAMKIQNRGLENVIQYLEAKLGIDEIDARLEATKD
jgi:hypothetical protein